MQRNTNISTAAVIHFCVVLVAVGIALAGYSTAFSATLETLHDPPPPTFAWSDFFPSATVGGITVQKYHKEDGTDPGPVIVNNMTVKDGNDVEIGTVTMQYTLWSGSTLGAAGATNRLGAVLFGGFNVTTVKYNDVNFSYYQIFTDNANASGVIDSGGINGKVNGDIPDHGADPGWDFAGDGAEFDYADVPANTFVNETVSFETALVCNVGTVHNILKAWTWDFTSTAGGGITGNSVEFQTEVTNTLFNLYTAVLPGGHSLANLGVGTCVVIVPEPSSIFLANFALIALLFHRRRKE